MILIRTIFEKRRVNFNKTIGLIIRGNTIAILFLTVIIFFYSIDSSALTGEDILDKVSFLELNKGDSYLMEMTMLSHKDGRKEEADMRVYLNRAGGTQRSIASFIKPADLRDDLYLSIDNNTWMYKRGLKRPIRISPRQKLFGDAGVAETVGINYSEKYSLINIKKENNYYYLELQAEDSSTAYQKANLWIEEGSFNLSRVILMAVNGQHLKELKYRNYRSVNGFRVSDILVKNLLFANDHSTELLIEKIYKIDLPVEAFQPLMLSKFDLFRRNNK